MRNQLGRHVYGVHRLDKGTSGILLFALSPEAGRTLSQAFEAQQVDKRYLAVVRGWPDACKARLITRCRANPTSAKPAVTPAPVGAQQSAGHGGTNVAVDQPRLAHRWPSRAATSSTSAN